MKLLDLIARQVPPKPWEEGDNIPWNDPGFSRRMLREHLSQEHDAASRRSSTINKHVGWINSGILSEKPSLILDLGCGPGLYTSRLASLGHTCVGIDYSPASIQFARETAQQENLACTYREQDMRQANYGDGFDFVMQIFGEFNTLSPVDASRMLDNANRALKPGGLFLMEVHTFHAVWQLGHDDPSWSVQETGLFSDQSHLLLEESFWDEQACAATRRFFVILLATGEVTRYAASYQAYTVDEYSHLLQLGGFNEVQLYLEYPGSEPQASNHFIALLAKKGENV